MDIIYVGSVVTDQNLSNYTGISIAGNKMELGIIANIARIEDDLYVISIPPIAPFPKDKNFFFSSRALCNETKNVKYVSFVNITIIKQISQIVNTFFTLKKIMHHKKNPFIISYNMFPQNGLPVLLISKIYRCNFAAIIADPPIDEVVNRPFVSSLLYKIYNKLSEWCIRACKNVVVLNKEVIIRYCPDARSIVVEGGVELESIDNRKIINGKNCETRNIVYSGNLSEYSGILEAVEAMKSIECDDIQLHIYGDGPLASRITEITHLQKNVVFHGKINNLEMIEIQKRAWILINPRVINNQISKYTFPSKLLEYLLSGTPIITTRLEGIAIEYDKFFVYSEGDRSSDFSNLINRIDNEVYQKYKNSAQEGKVFVLKHKNWKIQSTRIRDFIQTCT